MPQKGMWTVDAFMVSIEEKVTPLTTASVFVQPLVSFLAIFESANTFFTKIIHIHQEMHTIYIKL
jgi:hypothetical protein